MATKKTAKPKKTTPTVTITGTMKGELDVKRFYMPGVKIKCKCPACGAPWEMDMALDYLSYPSAGKPTNASGYCGKCEHEWPVMVIVRVTVEAAS